MKARCGFQGSITIEVSLLMPFLIFLIWNILYLALFTYNQSTILQGNYCTALRTERSLGTREEREQLAEKKYDVSVKKKLAGGNVVEEIEISEAVTVATTLNMQSPAIGFFHSTWQGKNEMQVEKWQPVTFIRNCRVVENIADALKNQDG